MLNLKDKRHKYNIQGNIISLEILKDKLKITLNDKEALEEILAKEITSDEKWYDIFEDIQCNSEWRYWTNEMLHDFNISIGLTDSPIIAITYYRDDKEEDDLDDGKATNGNIDSEVSLDDDYTYWYPEYMIKSELEELSTKGFVEFTKVT